MAIGLSNASEEGATVPFKATNKKTTWKKSPFNLPGIPNYIDTIKGILKKKELIRLVRISH